MAVNSQKYNLAYGFNNALQNLNPLPIVAKRAPSSSDTGEIGQLWVYSDQVWMFTSAETWTELAAAGNTGTFTELTVNGNTALLGALNVATGGDSIELASANGATNIGTDAFAKSIGIGNVTGTTSVSIQSGTGGVVIDSNSNGLISLVAHHVTAAAFAATNNAYVGTIVLTGQTIASSATQAITITNTYVTASNSIQLSVSNLNVSTNGAYLTILGTVQSVGSLVVHVQNNSGAALAATDSIIIGFQILG